MIGLDIGTNAVRAVEIELGDPPLIRRMGQVGLPVGAVVDGEVADVSAVSIALRQLWTQAGFKSRTVRVGMSSARVIVRTIEMPRLSRDDLISTIRLQLDDYVPLPADETVFDVRTLDGPQPTDQTLHLLLAATHQDAVQPLLMALQEADLKVAAVDVIPAALALALTHVEPEQDESVDIVLSIGAGTVVVIAAREGEPLFSRTLTNTSGRRTTERIASRLGIAELEAERYKRLGPTEDPSSAVATKASQESLDEIISEVQASLAFYGEQPGSRHVRRLLVTGGGSQLPGLTVALSDALGIGVECADPFARVRLGDTGFESADLPFLAPYMAAAIGVALGQARPKDSRIDLTPVAKRPARALGTRRLLVSAGVVVLVGAAGAIYMNGRSAIATEQDRLAGAQAHLADLQARLAELLPATGQNTPTGVAASPEAVAASIAATNIDWLAVERAVVEDSAPLGVITSGFQGALDLSGGPATSVRSARPGTLTFAATAPGLTVVADWLDVVAADPRFADPWAGGFTMTVQTDGSNQVQFAITMLVTDKNLVGSGSTTGVQP
ncbi:MAG: type IV pilus assembly protein PilM [Ilumatobacteraceae bacterium]